MVTTAPQRTATRTTLRDTPVIDASGGVTPARVPTGRQSGGLAGLQTIATGTNAPTVDPAVTRIPAFKLG